MTVEAVMRDVLRDELLYRKSGGGVTISGGEPLMQPTFTFDILRRVKEHNLHTAIETCGHVKWNTFERILAVTDLVIYDVKHMDSVQHEKLVGVGNELILENIKKVLERNAEVLVRLPLIPDLNDSDENLQKSAEFLRRLGIDRVEIIPYHEFAATKYELLGRDYVLRGLKPYTSEQLKQKRQKLAELGIKAKVGV
jgi:pyruvate formate lyase activating enzyme